MTDVQEKFPLSFDRVSTAGMDERVRKLWIEALESGEYSQARGALHRLEPRESDDEENGPASGAGFCCLGVLCDLAIRDGVPIETTVVEADGTKVMKYMDRTKCGCAECRDNPEAALEDWTWEGSSLPRLVQEWAGLLHPVPQVKVEGDFAEYGYTSLIHLNDSQKWDFNQIAEAIRGTV